MKKRFICFLLVFCFLFTSLNPRKTYGFVVAAPTVINIAIALISACGITWAVSDSGLIEDTIQKFLDDNPEQKTFLEGLKNDLLDPDTGKIVIAYSLFVTYKDKFLNFIQTVYDYFTADTGVGSGSGSVSVPTVSNGLFNINKDIEILQGSGNPYETGFINSPYAVAFYNYNINDYDYLYAYVYYFHHYTSGSALALACAVINLSTGELVENVGTSRYFGNLSDFSFNWTAYGVKMKSMDIYGNWSSDFDNKVVKGYDIFCVDGRSFTVSNTFDNPRYSNMYENFYKFDINDYLDLIPYDIYMFDTVVDNVENIEYSYSYPENVTSDDVITGWTNAFEGENYIIISPVSPDELVGVNGYDVAYGMEGVVGVVEGVDLPQGAVDIDVPDTGIIGGILEKIWDWILNFFEKLAELLKYLFIPYEGYFADKFNNIKNNFSGKFGFDSFDDMFVELQSIRSRKPDFGGYINIDMWDKHIPQLQTFIKGFFYALMAIFNIKMALWLIRGTHPINSNGGGNS